MKLTNQSSLTVRDVHSPINLKFGYVSVLSICATKIIRINELCVKFNSGSDIVCTFVLIKIFVNVNSC